ncbi:MAG TPA: hypothetical protein VK206_23030 [Anaerolineales bacterium]|nr:hypothetical protein [Anaerolineales bacterium]
MKQTNSRAVQDALKSIHENYGFMLEKGYEVVSVDDYDLGWQVVLREQDLFARIIRSRGEEEIYFQMGTQPPDKFIDIGSVIYAATGDKVPRWESSDTKVIKQYLDKIESYFEGEYLRNKDGLRAAQEEYYAAFSQGGVVSPPEPRGKPILYYLLMGIIILLILGALATLCLVLADRLFTAF